MVSACLVKNSPAVKMCAAPKRAIAKKMRNPRWRPRNGCDGSVVTKKEGNTNSPE